VRKNAHKVTHLETGTHFYFQKQTVDKRLNPISSMSKPFTVYRLPFTIYRLPFTVYRLPFTNKVTHLETGTHLYFQKQTVDKILDQIDPTSSMSKPFTNYHPWDKLILLDSGREALSRFNLLVRVASVLMPLKSTRPVDTLGQHQIYLFSRAEKLFYNYSQRPVANEGVSRFF
jgi:hypothetical protein